MDIVTIAGLSGSGKTSLVNILSDEGYIILDSIPLLTIDSILEIIYKENKSQKVALVINFNSKDEFEGKLDKIKEFSDKRTCKFRKFYLHAQNEKIIARFKEQRRLHPFMINKSKDSLEESIDLERRILTHYSQIADFDIDTTNLTNVGLRKKCLPLLSYSDTFIIQVVSFGFKHGLVRESDYVFDLRFLPNPFYIKELKPKTGLDDDVYNYVFSFSESELFYNSVRDLLMQAIERFKAEGRVSTTISFGCTGGQHRSVSFARRLHEELSANYETSVYHKELNKE